MPPRRVASVPLLPAPAAVQYSWLMLSTSPLKAGVSSAITCSPSPGKLPAGDWMKPTSRGTAGLEMSTMKTPPRSQLPSVCAGPGVRRLVRAEVRVVALRRHVGDLVAAHVPEPAAQLQLAHELDVVRGGAEAADLARRRLGRLRRRVGPDGQAEGKSDRHSGHTEASQHIVLQSAE